MNAELTTVIGQLSIEAGKLRTKIPNQVAVREPASPDAPGAGKGDLFIITEVQGQIENFDLYEQKLAHAIRDSYYLARGSITASLRRAIQTGSDMLYNRNSKVEADDRVVGGAVILAISNEDAFVAQIGPTAFFAILGDHIQRYPSRSIWLDETIATTTDEESLAMGLSTVVEPSLHHLRVASADMLVLADSRLAGRLALKDVVGAVTGGNIKSAVKNLADLAQSPTGSGLVVEMMETATASTTNPVKIAPPSQLSKFWPGHRQQESEAVKNGLATPEPAFEHAAVGESRAAAIFANTATLIQKPFSWIGTLTDRGQPGISSAPTPEDRDEAFAPHNTPSATEPAGPTPAPSPVSSEPDPAYEETDTPERDTDYYYAESIRHEATSTNIFSRGARWPIAAVLAFIALLGNAMKGVLRFFAPGVANNEEPRQAGRQAQEPSPLVSWKMLRNFAIAIPIIVAIIVSISYLQKGRLREAEYQEFLSTAQSKFEQAQSVEAPASALALINEAESALTQAEQIKPDQPVIAEMRQQMTESVDQVGNVQRLYYLPQQRQYTDPGTNTEAIVVQGVEIYVMDTGNDRLYHHRLNDQGEGLLPDDESVLITAKSQAIEEMTVGDLQGMIWMPTGGNRQTSELVILSNTGLLEYSLNWGITPAALASDPLVNPVAVDSYFGNFYVLDPQANDLLRYLPTNDGYGAAPQSYFPADQTVDLSNAVDMAIDGAVYVLFADGRINKYLSGQPTDFNLTGLDVPLNNPVAIYTAPDEEIQHVYVADAGNQRIVQLNKDGSFVRQFKPRAGEIVTFSNLQDIYVDEISERLFVLDSNNLYLGKIPTAQ